jgi:acrylyl-CoA reductase (NADPH) / 3-hydroxypropionyl-CoA dehydratase / 3-hydroxypropionyl-CoA synthetase
VQPANLTIAPAVVPAVNPVDSAGKWQAMRMACLDDPGRFHGDIARSTVHWFVPDVGSDGAWLICGEDGVWAGWDAANGDPVTPALVEDLTP